MNDKSWLHVKSVLGDALERPPADRPAFLDGACGADEGLRAQVDALLAAHEKAGEFLGQLPDADGAASAAPDGAGEPHEVGARIGVYTLVNLIGEGGFGSVYLAEQQAPVARRVALKIIKPGMDTHQVIARFEAERQALAIMDHPNIAKVFDAGATAAGRPYFVMELVSGAPITGYCDAHSLAIRGRLELFAQVCGAVQHAHQKGLIHRDIKPSNILVSTHDGRPLAKVIDFGIAKATAPRPGEQALSTHQGAFLGTPEYMSPEQAAGSPDIDTRADVYSLGVVLYELLAGATPFDARRLRAAAVGEMQRIIGEVDPPKPSTRLSTLGDSLPSVAARRAIEPARLGRTLRRDLDWIVMKALEKNPARRYDTASGLALDVQRYLDGEAVVAAPPSAVYRLRKFVRRNKAPVLAGALLSGTLVLGAVGTGAGLVRAEGQRRQAEQERDKARLERDKAEVFVRFMQRTLEGAGPSAAIGRDTTMLAEMMDRAAGEIEQGGLRDAPEVEVRLRNTIGDIYREIARYDSADTMLAKALDLARRTWPGDHADVAASVDRLARLRQARGRLAEAEALQTEALEMRRRLFPGDHSSVATSLNNLASARKALGRRAEAEPLLVESIEMKERLSAGDDVELAISLDNLAQLRASLGRHAEAEALYRRALEMEQRLITGDDPDLAATMNNLAAVLLDLGRGEEAEPLTARALEMNQRLFGGDHPMVAVGMNNLGYMRLRMGRAAEAEPLMVEALAMHQRLFPGDHPSVAMSLASLGFARQRVGRPAEAEPLLVQAVEMRRRLFAGDHLAVAESLYNLAMNHRDLGRPGDAEPLFREALDMYRRLQPAEHPDVTGAMANLAWTLSDLAWAARDAPDAADGATRAAEAEALLRQVVEVRERTMPASSWRLANVRSMLGGAIVAAAACDRVSSAEARIDRLREAEPLLTGSYESLVAAAADIPAHFRADRPREAAQRCARLYTLWDELAPGTEKSGQAARWQALSRADTTQNPP